jgi:hypothetical protein
LIFQIEVNYHTKFTLNGFIISKHFIFQLEGFLTFSYSHDIGLFIIIIIIIISSVTDLPFYVFIPVVCWAPVDLDPREMVTPGSFNR